MQDAARAPPISRGAVPLSWQSARHHQMKKWPKSLSPKMNHVPWTCGEYSVDSSSFSLPLALLFVLLQRLRGEQCAVQTGIQMDLINRQNRFRALEQRTHFRFSR